MATVDWNFSSGSPRMTRTSNVPAVASITVSLWAKVLTYSNWGELFGVSINGAAPQSRMFIYYDGAGDLFLGTFNAASAIWTDNYDGWFWLGIIGSAVGNGMWQVYYQRAGGSLTTSVLLESGNAFTPNTMAIVSQTDETGFRSGRHLYRSIKVWNTSLTLGQLQREIYSTKPIHTAGLTFWNPMLNPASAHIDRSGTGGNFSVTGSPASSQDDPGIPWQRLVRPYDNEITVVPSETSSVFAGRYTFLD